jgi:hypothetical protein
MAIVAIVGALAAFGADLRAANRTRQTFAAALAWITLAILDLVDAHTLRMLPIPLLAGPLPSPSTTIHGGQQ